jgi:hypothetical protein
VVNAVGSVTVTLHSGVTLAPLCFSNGGIKGLLAALRLHAAVVRSAEQPHTYLLNDVRDPLQRSMAMLQLQQVPSLSLSLMLQLQQVHSLSLSLSPSLLLQLPQVHSLSLSLSLSHVAAAAGARPSGVARGERRRSVDLVRRRRRCLAGGGAEKPPLISKEPA